MSELLPKLEGLDKKKDFIKSLIDHNIALILLNYKKSASAEHMINKTLTFLTTTKDLEFNNEKAQLIAKCRDNLLLTILGRTPQSYQNTF